MKITKIILLKEKCGWCNKKTVGQDESGFQSCVSCDYDSDSDKGKYKLSNEERHEKGMKIYDELICDASNEKVIFVCLCEKLKGHKGQHKSNEHPDFLWD